MNKVKLLRRAAALSVVCLPAVAAAAPVPVLEYRFNNPTGTTTPSTGSVAYPLTEYDADGTTAVNRNTSVGPSGLASDRAYAPAPSGTAKTVAKGTGSITSTLSNTSTITATFWVKGVNITSGGGSDRIFVLNGNDGGTAGTFEVETAGFNATSTGFNVKVGTAGQVGAGTGFVNTTDWAFVAVVYDGSLSSGNVKLYSGTPTAFNAMPVSTQSAATSTGDPAVLNFLVGNRNAGDRPSGYAIDNVRIYDSALTVTDIQSVYGSDVPEPASAGLLAVGAVGLLVRRRRRA
ncbi:MAG TPA: LamG-like jellyroll fold domain-containing protein [Humisphaera sp.]